MSQNAMDWADEAGRLHDQVVDLERERDALLTQQSQDRAERDRAIENFKDHNKGWGVVEQQQRARAERAEAELDRAVEREKARKPLLGTWAETQQREINEERGFGPVTDAELPNE